MREFGPIFAHLLHAQPSDVRAWRLYEFYDRLDWVDWVDDYLDAREEG